MIGSMSDLIDGWGPLEEGHADVFGALFDEWDGPLDDLDEDDPRQ